MTLTTVCAEGISWAPKRGPMLIHKTSFSASKNRILAVVGANGAGKSTLLRLLYRYQRPVSGQVFINDTDLWKMSARTAARSIAAVLQEQPTDFSLTGRQIVALGRTPYRSGVGSTSAQDYEIIESALDRLHLRNLASRMFGTLSGGERQRIMVARALAQQPEILILDEPTNHLDIRHQLEVLQMIRELDLTIITSLHDLNFAAEYADDVLVLVHGRTMAFGPTHEVLTEPMIETAFDVGVRTQMLQPSGQPHFTFYLNTGETHDKTHPRFYPHYQRRAG